MGWKVKSKGLPSRRSTVGVKSPALTRSMSWARRSASPSRVPSPWNTSSRAVRGDRPLKVSSSHLSWPSPWGALARTKERSSSGAMAAGSSRPVGSGGA